VEVRVVFAVDLEDVIQFGETLVQGGHAQQTLERLHDLALLHVFVVGQLGELRAHLAAVHHTPPVCHREEKVFERVRVHLEHGVVQEAHGEQVAEVAGQPE